VKSALALSVLVMFSLCPLFGQTLSPESPLGNLSERSTGVVLTALSEALQRGSKSIGVNDLIIALIIEDQEPNAILLFEPTPPGALFPPGMLLPTQTHKPFFQPRTAIDVLVKLNAILPHSKSLPQDTELPTSPALGRVYTTAKNMPKQLNQSEITVHASMVQAVVPLDLLAAALRERCEGTSLLEKAGITEESVLQAIQRGGDLEKGEF
jgi:hypothetical protein